MKYSETIKVIGEMELMASVVWPWLENNDVSYHK